MPRLSAQPLLGEYRDLGEKLPAYDDIAKYVFYTETSRQWDRAQMVKETGRIGTYGDAAYYLLYRPTNKSDWALDNDFLEKVAAKEPKRSLVVYCEKIWVHRQTLREWESGAPQGRPPDARSIQLEMKGAAMELKRYQKEVVGDVRAFLNA